MTSIRAKLPPDTFEPDIELIPSGRVLYRVHEPVFPGNILNDGTISNPGFGKSTRFAFFGNPIVPVLYVADKPEGAVHESVLHDAEPGEFLPGVHWRTKVLTAIELVSDLEVVSFHGVGLRKFGLYARDLTDTDREAYSRTVQWAEAAWKSGVHGVTYMCRHYNSSKAMCLFGDKLPPGVLRPVLGHSASRAFLLPEDAEWLARLALDMRVTLRPL